MTGLSSLPQTPITKKSLSLTPEQLGTVQVALGATCISFSAVFVRIVDVGPVAAGFYRMLFGGLVVLLYAILRREALWVGFKNYATLLIGAVCITLDITCWHQSIHYIGPGLATILGNFQVFTLVMIGVLFYREQLSKKFYLALPAAMIGLFMLVGFKWSMVTPQYRTGVFLGLATAAFYTVYTMVLRQAQLSKRKLSPSAMLAVVSLTAALFLSMAVKFEGETFHIPNVHNLLLLVGYGIAAQFIGWMLISSGLPKIKLSMAGMLILLQPAFSFLWDMLFFHRPTPPMELAGAVITLLAIYLGAVSRKEEKSEQKD